MGLFRDFSSTFWAREIEQYFYLDITCIIRHSIFLLLVGSERANRTEQPTASARVGRVDPLQLDIYGNTQEAIQRCKLELDKKLDKALETLIWSNKRSYNDDKAYIDQLSQSQVIKLYPLEYQVLSALLLCVDIDFSVPSSFVGDCMILEEM